MIAALGVGSVRVALENRVARRNLSQALLEKADAASRNLEWGKASVYSAAAREEDDTAEARWRTAHRGPVEVDPLLRVQLPGPGRSARALARRKHHGGRDHRDGPAPGRTEGRGAARAGDPAETVNQLTFSADGNQLAVASGIKLLVFNVESGELVTTLDAAGEVQQLSFSADGSRLAAGEGSEVLVYDTAPGSRWRCCKATPAWCARWSSRPIRAASPRAEMTGPSASGRRCHRRPASTST